VTIAVASADDVRALALQLPRSYQVEVRGVEKFRVGRIVWLAFSGDDAIMGIGFPKEERDGVIAAEPEKFLLPKASDLRYNWIEVRLAALPDDEMRELVVDAWRMCVPKRVAAEIEPHLSRLLAVECATGMVGTIFKGRVSERNAAGRDVPVDNSTEE
jgi:hypothetical protein